MRLVFAGTPEVALPSLGAIAGSGHELVAVLTRPDAPAGRGRRVEPSPVARWAREREIAVLTPTKPSDPSFVEQLAALAVDCVPVVAYGALIRPAVLSIPTYGFINLHFSLLPAWRGAAPVQHAILHGDEMTGASVFQLDEGLDTGPVYGSFVEPIRPRDTSHLLLGRLADAGAQLLLTVLDAIAAGAARAVAQPDDGISVAPKLSVADARVRWGEPAFAVDRRIRACTDEPGAWSELRGERVKLGPVKALPLGASDVGSAGPGRGRPGSAQPGGLSHAGSAQPGGLSPAGSALPVGLSHVGSAQPGGLSPGEISLARDAVVVGTGSGAVELGTVRPAGKRAMPALDWARGARLVSGEAFA